jgi:hypothetical protein
MMDIKPKVFTEDDAPKHMDNVEQLDWAEGANFGYEYLRQQLAEQTSGEPVSSELVAWQSITTAYKKYVTQSTYAKFSPNVKRWYRPYNCSNCTEKSDGSVEVLLEALREIMYMGLDSSPGTDREYFCESQLRICIAKAAVALNAYSSKPKKQGLGNTDSDSN